jgi:histidinol-phosphate aminotransferase
MNPADLIDQSVKEIIESKKGRQFYENLAETGRSTRMSLNENLLVDKSFSSAILQEAARRVDARLYPTAKGADALKAISENLGLWEDQIIVGSGSDEILDLIAKVFVGSGEALILDPTFEMYRLYAGLVRGSCRSVMMTEDFRLNAQDVLGAITDKTKVIFLCSPNNPTGKQFSREDVLKVINESERLVVLDEAYVDFAPYSLTHEAAKYNNLLVLRTFSKAFGLAGLRIGYATGDSEIIDWLRAAEGPFSVNSIAQEACRLILENRRVYASFINKTLEERKYLMAELQTLNGIKAFESDANFVLFKVFGEKGASAEVCKRLKVANIDIRDRGDLPMLSNCMRVTVSDRDSNMKFVRELEKALRSSV